MILCQICHKNPATIHAQEIRNGKSRILHLCIKCAGQQPEFAPMLKKSGLPQMLKDLIQGKMPSALMGEEEAGEPSLTEEEKKISCRRCGWSLEQFKKTGLMGCTDCYRTFEGHYEAVQSHAGKPDASAPERDKTDEILVNLQKSLTESIRREEFEQAAELRDKIAEMKKKTFVREKRS